MMKRCMLESYQTNSEEVYVRAVRTHHHIPLQDALNTYYQKGTRTTRFQESCDVHSICTYTTLFIIFIVFSFPTTPLTIFHVMAFMC